MLWLSSYEHLLQLSCCDRGLKMHRLRIRFSSSRRKTAMAFAPFSNFWILIFYIIVWLRLLSPMRAWPSGKRVLLLTRVTWVRFPGVAKPLFFLNSIFLCNQAILIWASLGISFQGPVASVHPHSLQCTPYPLLINSINFHLINLF